ncbi:hypothetical protein AB0L67_38380 [Streptomyces flaveolus]|uniref:hypothetical protein n=1 Tax=Streptomyces flaveolus TaxID=67297 RepID=UPI00343DCE16
MTAWLREHPGVRVVCRDGSGGFAQATTDAGPTIVQAGHRRHLWHGLAETALEEIGAHASCRSTFGPPLREGERAATTRERRRRRPPHPTAPWPARRLPHPAPADRKVPSPVSGGGT